jgi:hypothetical protein
MNHGACIEVAAIPSGLMVRDSANVDGFIMVCSSAAWCAFTAALILKGLPGHSLVR